MSDSLREALEKLADERDSVSGHVGSDYHIRPYELRELLAAHPVEPAACEHADYYTDDKAHARCSDCDQPMGQAQPVASRERVAEVLRAHQEDSVVDCICGWRDGANDEDLFGHQVLALLAAGVFREPQPVDREALGEWLYGNFSGRRGADSAPWSARKAETHEYWFKRADAVLALTGGDAK